MIENLDVAEDPPRILVVDDDGDCRELLGLILEHEGFLVIAAASGAEALATAGHEPFDLVLLDVVMPGMDGWQVAAMLKGDDATKHIPIIMVTGLDDRRSITGQTLAADILTKPVSRVELCKCVWRVLGRTNLREAS